MIFKFKNGYQVQIRDCGNKTREELIEIAKKAVEDAVKLEKNIDTNTSFMPTKIREAIRNEDQAAFEREYNFLMRDLDADLTDAHKNYPKMYRKEVIDKLIKQYEEALRMLKVANDVFGEDYYTSVEEKLNQLKNNWNRPDKRYRAHIEYANGEVTIKDFDAVDDARRDIETRIEFAKDGKNPVVIGYVIDNLTGDIIKTVHPETGINDAEDNDAVAVIGYIEYADKGAREKHFDNIDDARDELQKLLDRAKKVGEPVARALILNADTEDVIEEVYKDKELFTDSEDMKDANDIPPYRVKITYANGEVTIKYVEDLTAAVRDIRRRIEVGKKDGNAVVVALVFDSMTDEIILSSDRDEDIRVKDAPPPYYDPTDYPTIKSDYSPDRLKREIRHTEKSQPIIDEFNEVIAEIDELIEKGTDALIEAGWSKDDARRAIAARYMDLEKELRRNKKLDLARQLHTKIRALEKAWDLRV